MQRTYRGREIRLASRPEGVPGPETFEIAEVEVGPPAAGQVLVRNHWMSVDPAMRGRMRDTASYIAPFQIGAPLEGAAVGTVVASADDRIPTGATVRHWLGWREYALVPAGDAQVLDVSQVSPEDHLGVLGFPGLTAYIALTEIAPVATGDTVLISGAAGAVGLAAGAIARILGAERVVGSAGGAAKGARLVEELGYDAAIDYRAGALDAQLAQAAPAGIDVYLDSVGGDHLQAAIGAMKDFGRIALCGQISQYNASRPQPGPDNLLLAVSRRLTLRGFIVRDHTDKAGAFAAKATRWLREGRLTDEKTVFEGIAAAPEAFVGLFKGDNFGKMLVRLGEASHDD